ncbi:MAG: D-amino acid dehydrogenase [Lysobacter sp.]
MKVLILGSGVIGTSAAYYLARAGHEVEVIDRQPAPALETSYANAGEVSPGYSTPWAGPGVPMKAIKWLLMRHRPLVIKPDFDPTMLRWCLAMLRNCTHARYRVNKERMVRLAEYSRDCLRELREATGIEYDARQRGTLQLFRTQRQLDDTGKDIEILRESGVAFELLDRDGYIRAEPALDLVKEKFVGALRLPGDETGDCFKFTQNLAALAQALGARFDFGVDIQRLETQAGELRRVHTSAGVREADAYVLALGSYSPLLLAPVDIRIPVYPVKGYSLTLPVGDDRYAPQSTIMDETHKVAVTRLGDRIRVGGTAELAGYDRRLHESRRRTLNHVVSDLFPRGGDPAKAEFWTGLRPMTPDGTPVLGATRVRKLFLATGHGTLGWTMAAGTGRVIADLVSGREPGISLEGLGPERYGQ